jgi:hypothetical protein
MGFFSWKTNDTLASIWNKYSCREIKKVYLKDNEGRVWEEGSYEGYGKFGGKDYFELFAEMNKKKYDDMRVIIEIYYNSLNNKDVLYPNLVENKNFEWCNERPEDCPHQGFF